MTRIVKKQSKKADKKKKIDKSAIPEGAMTHAQVIVVERPLTQKEVAECGTTLAKEELQLDQVRKEKKETFSQFDATIKGHLREIMRLSQAIDTGILSTPVECEVVLNREKEEKTCYPKNGDDPFTMQMNPDDFDLLT